MTATWQPGKTYAPGSLVVPTSVVVQTVGAPNNPSYATGDFTGWSTADTGRWAVVAEGSGYVARTSGSGQTSLGNTVRQAVKPGQSISISAQIRITNAGTDDAVAQAVLEWYDASDTLLPDYVPGNEILGKGGFFKVSSASGRAPATAASFSISLSANPGTHGAVVDWQAAKFTYAVSNPPAGLVYKATQAAPGKSASVEPTWPGDLVTPVTDNQVTWQGVLASQIVWQAVPFSESGATEPSWPDQVGGLVTDGSASLTTITPMVSDAACPHSKQVVIASLKVFAGDTDITRYSTTANPLDWHTINDAGFIPHGQSAVQETTVTALALYRSNVAILTASNLQLWKADPDPAAIVILDTVESVGTAYNRATVPVEQDTFFVSPLGIRSISVSASQQAMGEGDIGQPMDAVVRSLLDGAANPLAAFFPNLGQTLFFIGDQVVVLFKNKLAKMTGWALYQLPITVTDVATLDGDLYIRDATAIYWFNAGSKVDYDGSFPVVLEWQYLEFGSPGTTKTFMGVSLESDCTATVSAGFDVKVPTRRTGEKRLPNTSEAFVPMSFVAKQAAFRLTMDSAQMDSFTRLNVYFRDGGQL